jgi:hypothetical protein
MQTEVNLLFFLNMRISFEIIPAAFELFPPEYWAMTDNLTDKSVNNWDAYPTYQAYLDMMVQFAADFPALCRLDTIGYFCAGTFAAGSSHFG